MTSRSRLEKIIFEIVPLVIAITFFVLLVIGSIQNPDMLADLFSVRPCDDRSGGCDMGLF